MSHPGTLILIMATAVVAPLLAYAAGRRLTVPVAIFEIGLGTLLGAFAAGLLTRLVLNGAAPESSAEVLGKIEAMGFGFLVPVFFIVTGINFDLDALLGGGRALLLLPVFLLLFLLVRGASAWLLAPETCHAANGPP